MITIPHEKLVEASPLLSGDIWCAVPGASQYLVSTDGRVASFVLRRPRILNPGLSGKYRSIQVKYDDGIRRQRYVHHLVLETTYGPAPEGHEARHLDGDRLNNAATNLRWGTRRENHADKIRHGTSPRGVRNPMARLTPSKVRAMRAMYATGSHTYASVAAAFGVSTMTALRAIKKESWSHV